LPFYEAPAFRQPGGCKYSAECGPKKTGAKKTGCC